MLVYKTYYNLTKPGIIYGNALTVAAGFLLASDGDIHIVLLAITLLGVSLVIASGCVFNNYLDREIDAVMTRTKKRAMVRGIIPVKNALLFGTVLGIIGLFLLARFANPLTCLLGVIGLIFYVIVYGIAKRRSVYGTLVGSVSGALPPVAGYTAVSGQLDMGALILFLILVCWQMAHFYAIAMYRRDEYKAAGIPVLSVKKGLKATRSQVLIYVIGFIITTTLLTLYGYTGYVYLIVILVLGFVWLYKGTFGIKTKDYKLWGRKMFMFSLIVLLSFSALISVGSLLP